VELGFVKKATETHWVVQALQSVTSLPASTHVYLNIIQNKQLNVLALIVNNSSAFQLKTDNPKKETSFGAIQTPQKPCYISERSAENLLAQVLVLQESLNHQLPKRKSTTAQSLLQETELAKKTCLVIRKQFFTKIMSWTLTDGLPC